ncbi:hypothetical protein BMS3Bbin07_00302 [bacterium BMS3Bbin07]|nr:hypothetical protein BMS3Bbin07_00302 [bacterium BMS3Bbin07]
MMPEVIVKLLEGIAPLVFFQEPLGLKILQHLLCTVVIVIVKPYSPVQLCKVAVGLDLAVAIAADPPHKPAPLLSVTAFAAAHHASWMYHIPLQAFGDIVCCFQVADTAHMAGGTGGCRVIPGLPGAGRRVPVPAISVGKVQFAMAAFVIYLYVWMVRTYVALGTGLGFPCFGDLELVPAVADRAITDSAVRIAHADTAGPAVVSGFFIGLEFYFHAVAHLAAALPGSQGARVSFRYAGKLAPLQLVHKFFVLLFIYYRRSCKPGMCTPAELPYFRGVTLPAGFR